MKEILEGGEVDEMVVDHEKRTNPLFVVLNNNIVVLLWRICSIDVFSQQRAKVIDFVWF